MARRERVTDVPFREWPWHKRAIEMVYRWTHHGQIRTIVIRRNFAGAPGQPCDCLDIAGDCDGDHG